MAIVAISTLVTIFVRNKLEIGPEQISGAIVDAISDSDLGEDPGAIAVGVSEIKLVGLLIDAIMRDVAENSDVFVVFQSLEQKTTSEPTLSMNNLTDQDLHECGCPDCQNELDTRQAEQPMGAAYDEPMSINPWQEVESDPNYVTLATLDVSGEELRMGFLRGDKEETMWMQFATQSEPTFFGHAEARGIRALLELTMDRVKEG